MRRVKQLIKHSIDPPQQQPVYGAPFQPSHPIRYASAPTLGAYHGAFVPAQPYHEPMAPPTQSHNITNTYPRRGEALTAPYGQTALSPPFPPREFDSDADAEASRLYQWPDGDFDTEFIFERPPKGHEDQGWKWRSSGRRSEGLPKGARNVDHKKCLGVMHCGCRRDDHHPSRFYRPRGAVGARKKQLESTCHICHQRLVHMECVTTLTTWIYNRQNGEEFVFRRHHGSHNHPRPPNDKLRECEVERVDRQVRQNPQLTAQQLRVGAEPNQIPLGDINAMLLSSRKARAVVGSSKVRQGIELPLATRNGGFQFLESFSRLQTTFITPWIKNSDFLNNQFVTMQTPFMAEVFLRDSVKSWSSDILEVKGPHHGVITDGSHDFFKEGILLTSLVFSQIVLRWVPVLFTWVGVFDTEHHRVHFLSLFKNIEEQATALPDVSFDEHMLSEVGFEHLPSQHNCSLVLFRWWTTHLHKEMVLSKASLI